MTEADKAEIQAACLAADRDMSEVALELLLAWARRILSARLNAPLHFMRHYALFACVDVPAEHAGGNLLNSDRPAGWLAGTERPAKG